MILYFVKVVFINRAKLLTVQIQQKEIQLELEVMYELLSYIY